MIGEINLYGVLVPSLLVWCGVAVLLTMALRGVLRFLGAYRLIWHPALFNLALFVILLGCVVGLAQSRIPS